MTTAIDLEFLPTDTNEDRGVHNLGRCTQHLWLSRAMRQNDIVANSRKNLLEAWW